MFSNIIYVLATTSLLAGSSITFYKSNKDEPEEYLYLIGTTLFFIKSTICLVEEVYIKLRNRNDVFPSAYQRIDIL